MQTGVWSLAVRPLSTHTGQLAPRPAATPLVPEIHCSPGVSLETGDGAYGQAQERQGGWETPVPLTAPLLPSSETACF